MKGFVTKLCDVSSIVIPEEMLEFQVDEQQVEAELQGLGLRYAKEETVEMAQTGDMVVCHADQTSYPDGRSILLYPGMDLPGAQAAEQAVLGKQVGDTVTTQLAGKPAELVIAQILRRTPVEVNDALIAGIGLENVATVEDYRNYLRAKKKKDLQMERSKEIVRYIMDQMVTRSSFVYDPQEMEQYTEKAAEEYLQEMAEMGMEADPVEEIRKSAMDNLKQGWIAEAYCKEKGVEIDQKMVEEQADQMAEMMGLMGETVPDREELVQMALQGACYDTLFLDIDKIINEKMGGTANGND